MTMQRNIAASARIGAVIGLLVISDTGYAEQSRGKLDYWLESRVRSESVTQENALRDATAITLRNRLGLAITPSEDLKFVLEVENTYALQDDYNSTTNGRSDYSIVVDPEDTEINQGFFTYKGIDNTAVTIGRQKLVFDNARFIGNVGWRQNEQTFDAISLKITPIDDTVIKLAYIDTVRRIFGPDSANGATSMQSPVVNVTYSGFEKNTITAYGYFLSFDDTPSNSNRTLGVRLAGQRAFAQSQFKYLFEYADQADYESGASAIDADYWHVKFAVSKAGYGVELGAEQLSGDGAYAFQTPLATGHAFNGWSDQFLATPVDGLVDQYIGVNAVLADVRIRAIWHEFSADNGSSDYGSELNLVATRQFGKRFVAGAKFADYRAKSFRVDATKIWLFLQFKYAL